MAGSYRHGSPTAFWNNVAAGANATSSEVVISRGVENLVLYVTGNGATTITVEAAHGGAVTTQGILPEGVATAWGPLFYLNDAVTITLAGAGTVVKILPDFVGGLLRLRTSAAVTLTAGLEMAGE